MRHRNSGRKFSRTPSHRKELMQNLARALLLQGKIKTTLYKAKDLRGVVEPLITLGKRDDLHARRLAYKVLKDHKLVQHLFNDIAPLFKDIPGGYTRVTRLSMPRQGDNAPMAVIEFVQEVEKSVPDSTPPKKVESKEEVG
ncbi:MAG: 50S ribosomal protein L17 [Desulfovibrionaceae bacterium]|nr:50S ribosomal protein L17 [Desulfovibrionaceae bacterium]